MRVIWTIFIFIVIVIVGLFIFIYTGKYNIAATKPHTKLTEFILNTTTEQSIRTHAVGITVPSLDDESMIKTGFDHYKDTCVECHGAPGVKPSEIGKGLYPEPPELADEVDDISSEELYWITKNGIKMTGMPAWGKTHSDDKIWTIVAFMKQLPQMNAEDYKNMGRETGVMDQHEVNSDENKEHNHNQGDVEHHH